MSMREEATTRLRQQENNTVPRRSSESSRQRLERRHRESVSDLSLIIGAPGLDKGVLSIHNLKHCGIARLIPQIGQPQAFCREICGASREIHRSTRSNSLVVERV